MKYLILVTLLVIVSSNSYLEVRELDSIGQVCQNNGGFNITSFTVSPFPPQGCSLQAVSVAGIFTTLACPDQIHVHEIYNQRQSYNQDFSISGCYGPG